MPDEQPNLLNKNSYLTFDGVSIRDVINRRLNQSGVFTDQNFQGSNISGIIDIISYSFSTLLFYLNKTSSGSMFSEAQLYENMNRIVKNINYKPLGKIGQFLNFSIKADKNLNVGNYIIPRYSYVDIGGINFSVTDDISFFKNTNEVEFVGQSNQYILKQGIYDEMPIYNAVGIDNERIFISTNNQSIDHFSIDVYVKADGSDVWEKWDRVNSIFFADSNSRVFEVFYNQNKNYELKFGDNINGKSLNTNDKIAIFYLKIDPSANTVGAKTLLSSNLVRYNSISYNEILNNAKTSFGEYLGFNTISNIRFDNDFPSTGYTEEESVESIRKNAPEFFKTQNRLVTIGDFESHIKTNFSYIISDVQALNNDDYIESHLKYLYNIGLKNPQLDDSVLFNQVNFSNSCNFNNIYLYLVPKQTNMFNLNISQKSLIAENIEESKLITANILPFDPVYMLLDFCVNNLNVSISDVANTKLKIIRNRSFKKTESVIKSEVVNIIKKYFNRDVNKMGQNIDLYQINSDILSIEGVDIIQTVNDSLKISNDGISVAIWNRTYPSLDFKVYNQNIKCLNFQFPIFDNIENLNNRIVVI